MKHEQNGKLSRPQEILYQVQWPGLGVVSSYVGYEGNIWPQGFTTCIFRFKKMLK